jgi:hypothetical protein
MARKLSRARRKEMAITITPQKGCWIKYQLNLRRITMADIALKANVSISMVSHFLSGCKNSEKVKTAIAAVLGFADFDTLIAASRGKEAA